MVFFFTRRFLADACDVRHISRRFHHGLYNRDNNSGGGELETSIKIRFHGDKATIRWKTPSEKEYLKKQMMILRDLTKGIEIKLRNEKGDIMPPLPKPSPLLLPVSGEMKTESTVIKIDAGERNPTSC